MHLTKFQWGLEGKRNDVKIHLDPFLGYREKVKWRFTTNQMMMMMMMMMISAN